MPTTLMPMITSKNFAELVIRLDGQGDRSAAYDELIAAYSEPHRYYHSLVHLEECLAEFDGARSLSDHPDEVEAAIWFHDAIYDPRAKDNEDRSAAWAVRVLLELGVAAEVAGRVGALVLLTKHDEEPHLRDGDVLVDVDLAILGREPRRFAEYNRQIRQEYAWVPEEHYRIARSLVLESFAKRSQIYRTEFFRNRYEAQARQNLAAEIDLLRS